jgi:outer membrane protein assembly factor BamA
VHARPKLREILFIGNSAFTGRKLRDRIALAPEKSCDDLAPGEARREILELYSKAGYPAAEVSYKLGPAEAG